MTGLDDRPLMTGLRGRGVVCREPGARGPIHPVGRRTTKKPRSRGAFVSRPRCGVYSLTTVFFATAFFAGALATVLAVAFFATGAGAAPAAFLVTCGRALP